MRWDGPAWWVSGYAAPLKPPPPVLPFGPTLHYTGCGCPYSWAVGCSLCDWGDSWLQQAHSRLGQEPGQSARLSPIRKLKVAYCIPHANITGGLKVLLEQMRLLRERGHMVVVLTRSDLTHSTVPPWSDVAVDADVVCRLRQRFRDVCDVDSCDVVVTGIFHQAPEWLVSATALVLYYEQGHEWLFGDLVRFCEAGGARAQDTLFHMFMHLPVALAAVLEAVQAIICHEFGRSCMLEHNCVDCRCFAPGPPAAEVLAASPRLLTSPSFQVPTDGERQPLVLLVGNPRLVLKGFDCAIATLGLVHRRMAIEVHWVCQQEPCSQLAALINSCGLRISLHVNPPQDQLLALYRGHDCFLFTSQYEAWGMPVLEAMASGLAVVAADTAGVGSFATHNLNCLMAPTGGAAELAHCVLSVLEDAPLRLRLAAAARETAQRFAPRRSVEQLERVLYSLTACRQELMALRLQALPDSQRAVAAAQQAQLRCVMSKSSSSSSRERRPGDSHGSQCEAGASQKSSRSNSSSMNTATMSSSSSRRSSLHT